MAGRPTKLINWIDAFEDVVNEGVNAIIFTDDELLTYTNMKVDDEHQIDERTFQRWKAGDIKSELYDRFCRLYKNALLTQKKHLFFKLQDEEDKWQKYAWIIERKFSDWNLKRVSEIDHTTKGESINIISLGGGVKPE